MNKLNHFLNRVADVTFYPVIMALIYTGEYQNPGDMTRRFMFNDPEDCIEDSAFYVDAESEEAAWPIFRKRWAEYAYDERSALGKEPEFQADDYCVVEVGQTEHRFGPRPTCCDAVDGTFRFDYEGKGPAIVFKVYQYNHDLDQKVKHLRWVIRDVWLEITYCPHCGTKLPELESKENPPQPIYAPDDQEGHCLTCDSDSHGWCQCNPASAAYKIVKP